MKFKNSNSTQESSSSFELSKTYLNLARAFAGETQAGARYQFLAKKCKTEGYHYLESMLKTLAKNEMSHAKICYDYITKDCTLKVSNIEINAGYPFKCGTLEEEFLFASNNERSEAENIYPSFAKVASDEGFTEIANSFTMIAGVEKCHTSLLEQIYSKLKTNTLYKNTKPIKWKCSECGYENTIKQVWESCPLCSLEKGYAQVPIEVGKD